MDLFNEDHYVPKFLQRGWEAESGHVWVHDVSAKQIRRQSIKTTGTTRGLVAFNQAWSHWEGKAAAAIRQLRKKKAPTQSSDYPYSDCQLPKTELEALHVFFWTLRTRCEDSPQLWREPGQAQVLRELIERGAAAFSPLIQKYQLFQIWLRDGQHPFVLGTTTVFPLQPVQARGVLCLPIAERTAVVVADKRIIQTLPLAWTGLDLGRVSCGTPSSLFILPRSLVGPPESWTALSEELCALKREYQPRLLSTWSTPIDLRDP